MTETGKDDPFEGVIYTKPGKKIAEHGGFSSDDTNVALLLSSPGIPSSFNEQDAVQTTQVAPTILAALGIQPNSLQAVRMEHTPLLPGLMSEQHEDQKDDGDNEDQGNNEQ